ncbi:KAP family P-loop NTPase fold protein [Bacillus thuringiensis]|uniref:KAP family P-loop NTPase fold protein n=1 Tax=Bacillus thuringiensis TaxID=1428 RepID=UPI000BF96E53|nr:P-loop NTPase fold protein [Bacillus thuringiensis]PEQ29770.1 NTPase KAP [Bacillus thuringiensis]
MNEDTKLKQKIKKSLREKQQVYKMIENILVILLLATGLFALEGLLDKKIYSLSIVLEEIVHVINSYWFGFSIFIPIILFFIYVLIKKKYISRIIDYPAFTFKFDIYIIGILLSFLFYIFSVKFNFFKGELSSYIEPLGLGLYCFYGMIVLVRNANIKQNNEDKKYKSFRSDEAIKSFEEDELERTKFVKRLVKSVNSWQEEESIVIGLYGAWGTGKTSIFNLMKKKLELEKETVIVSFNPWYFKDEEQLILQFFNKLIAEIEKNFSGEKSKLISNIKKYSQKLTSVTLRFGIINFSFKEFITGGTDGNDIHELKKDIEDQLEREGKKIIVLIDDLDRLDDKEIHAVFKLVKVIADFRYTTYVLSFDEEKVGKILSEQYSSETQNEIGQSFLEKIIQVPLHLPPADQEIIRIRAVEGIEEILKENDIVISNQELTSWRLNWNYSFGTFPLTIRAAKRYQNSIFFSLPLVEHEVHYLDYLYIEAIRVFLPNLYKFIYQHSEKLLGTNYEPKSEIYKDYETEFDNLLKSYNPDQKERIKFLINLLFPMARENNSLNQDNAREWAGNQRICSPEYFEKYLVYSVRLGQLPDIKFNNLIKDLENKKREESLIEIRDMIIEYGLDNMIEKFYVNVTKLNSKQAGNLNYCLIQLEDLITNGGNHGFSSIMYKIATLIIKLVDLQEESQKKLVIKANLKKIRSLVFCEKIFSTAIMETNGNELDDIAIPYIEKIKKEINNPNFFNFYKEHIRHFLYHWYMFGDKNELFSIVKKWGKEGKIEQLLICYAKFNSEGYVEDLPSNGYNDLAYLNLTELIAEVLSEKYSVPKYEINNPKQYDHLSEHEKVATYFLLRYHKI